MALLETLVIDVWQQGRDLAIPELVPLIANPPMSRLGLFDVDVVIGPPRRHQLAVAVETLLESSEVGSTAPSAPIDLRALLSQPNGDPAASVLTFAHSSDDVRQFLLAVVLAKLRTYAHSIDESGLAILLYVDDGDVFLPSGREVASSAPLRDMLNSWNRFGIGVALVAEEPVNIDDHALDVCETWLVGRTPVRTTRQTIVEELDLVNPPIDEELLDETLSKLGPGQFVLRSPRLETLQTFQLPNFT